MIVFKFGSMSTFLPDEEVLHTVPSVGFISSKSFPSYRLFFPLRPLWSASLYITDRRVVLVAYLFGFVFQEFTAWYPAKAPQNDQELVDSTCVGNMRVLGPYLEVVSQNNNRPWYWRWACSPRIRMRFYMKRPEPLYESVYGGLNRGKESS